MLKTPTIIALNEKKCDSRIQGKWHCVVKGLRVKNLNNLQVQQKVISLDGYILYTIDTVYNILYTIDRSTILQYVVDTYIFYISLYFQEPTVSQHKVMRWFLIYL